MVMREVGDCVRQVGWEKGVILERELICWPLIVSLTFELLLTVPITEREKERGR